jgi:hypothetical protein
MKNTGIEQTLRSAPGLQRARAGFVHAAHGKVVG